MHASGASMMVPNAELSSVGMGDPQPTRDKEGSMATNHDRIEVNPRVMLGKPVIRGTRVTVELILRKLAEGATEEELLDGYPHLTVNDIRAAMGYAADVIAHEELVVPAGPASIV